MLRSLTRLALIVGIAVLAGGAASPVAGAAPTITSLDPNVGFTVGGDLVFVCGSDLSTVTGVTVDQVSVDWLDEGDGCLSIITPDHAVGTAQVRLLFPGGSSPDAGTADDFIYAPPCAQPVISSVSPSSGPDFGGNTVVIKGSNLTATIGVTFGFATLAADLNVVSDSELRVTAPAAPVPGKTGVVILNTCGASSDTPADDYTYVHVVQPAPTITSVSPNRSLPAGGDTIDLFGTGFDQTTDVRFGTIEADVVSVLSSTHLKVVVPPGTSGTKVSIVASNAAGVSPDTAADDFTYGPPLPTVTKVSPPSGKANVGGTTLITGTNLTGVKQVKFGTKSARKIYVFPNFVIAIAPPQPRGVVPVTVVTAAGSSLVTSLGRYVYL